MAVYYGLFFSVGFQPGVHSEGRYIGLVNTYMFGRRYFLRDRYVTLLRLYSLKGSCWKE